MSTVKWTTCGHCGGTGMLVKVAPEGGACEVCGGTGKSRTLTPEGTAIVCKACQGTGLFSIPTGEQCPGCEGKGQVPC